MPNCNASPCSRRTISTNNTSPAVACAICRTSSPACPSDLSKLTADEATAKAHATDPIAIGGRTYPREDIPEILGGKLDALPKNVRETTRIPLGTYRGLRFGIVLHSAIPARCLSRRRHHTPVRAVAGPPGAACRPERPGTPGQCLRLRMRPCPARPRHRRIPASRLSGPTGQALPA